MNKNFIAFVFVFGVLAGCAGPTGEQGVFAAKSAFQAALQVAVRYAQLPRCSDTQPAPCSKQEIIDKANRAAIAAKSIIDTAENLVRSKDVQPSFANTQVALANSAVAQFTAITNEMEK
jgi:hypothetical protein